MRYIISTLLLSVSGFLHALTIDESVNGVYHLATPERGAQKVLLQFGELSGKKVIAVAACEKCPPAVYSYQKEQSQTLKTHIFMTSGLYLIYFKENTFVLVQPDGLLGRKVWNKIGHANIYAKEQSGTLSMDRQQIDQYAIDLSKRIMEQDVGKMAHSSGTYHLAVPQQHMGRSQSTYQIELTAEPKKQVDIKSCSNCSKSEYQHLPEESAIAGVDVYRHATSYYLFDLKDGVLIYTFANAGGLGKKLWDKHSNYNVYSNNQAYIRQLLTSKEKQNTIDQLMADYFKKIKDTFEEQAEVKRQAKVANQTLPIAGMKDQTLNKGALAAANRWAKAWDWKEKLKNAYVTSNDWSITRNPLSGIITGRNIRGVVTMNHPDGRCRFQYVAFREEYDGSSFMNLHMTGIGPIYDLNCDKI